MRFAILLLAAAALLVLAASPAVAQNRGAPPAFPSGNITAPPPPVPAGIKVDSVTVHSPALVGKVDRICLLPGTCSASHGAFGFDPGQSSLKT